MRLIDADALMEDLKQSHDWLLNIYEGLQFEVEKRVCSAEIATFNEIGLRIKAAPTIDAEPVRHGQGCIISGYQGIGKSTLAKCARGYIDLESGNFFVNGRRSEDWYIPYCQIAKHLAEQGYRVFVSSHSVVRDYLSSLPINVKLFACFPSFSLEKAWVKKLENRYNASNLDKDYLNERIGRSTA